LYYCCSYVHAQQNLVPNGSFEEYDNCPSHAEGFYVTAAKYWTMPSGGTSDYFNVCATEEDFPNHLEFSVPENYIGFQEARTGVAYGGLLFSQGNDPDHPLADQTYGEYMQIKLIEPLENGKFYQLQFFLSNAYTNMCSNSIGCLFSDHPLNLVTDEILPYTPQFQSDTNEFFCDSVKWFEENYTFQSQGNEQYLIIGVFTSLHVSKMSDYFGNIISGPEPGTYGLNSYYYIDDVSLTETSYDLPNVFTPNSDGTNDLFTFDLVEAAEIQIFNRWGNVVYISDTVFEWDGKSNGSECPEGVYFYRIKTKGDYTMSGFISLMR